jgi:NADPH2:quinone reductase
MRAVEVAAPGVVNVIDAPVPEPQIGELLVQVRAGGICGTDLHILDGEFPPAPYPLIPGHEFAGVVAQIGKDVKGFSEGDRVAVDPSLFCGTCGYCRSQRGNLCDKWGAIGDTTAGAFGDYVTVPAPNAYHMPDSMSFGAGALVEPVSCAVHALDRLNPPLGCRVLVVGAGTMGLILAQLLRFAGAGTVTLVDQHETRRAQAEVFGFSSLAASVAEAVELNRGGFDCVVDATGVTRVVQDALRSVRKGGTLMIFGVTPAGEAATFEPFRIYNEEITIVGSMAVLASYGRAMDLVAAEAVDASKMITNVLPLERFVDAVQLVRSGTGLKTQIAL